MSFYSKTRYVDKMVFYCVGYQLLIIKFPLPNISPLLLHILSLITIIKVFATFAVFFLALPRNRLNLYTYLNCLCLSHNISSILNYNSILITHLIINFIL